jgi:hypothetical protein
MNILNNTLAYRYMSALHFKRLGWTINLMAGGGLILRK